MLFRSPGGAVACEPGSDERTPEQRAHDALVHQWALGSTVDPARPAGVATIVVRVTPEQLEDPTALVETDSGTQLSVRQAVSMAGSMPWFVSLLRDGREELHRIDVDAHPERRLASALQRLVLYAAHGGCTFPGCSAQTEPSARTIAFLVDKINSESIPVVFYIESSSQRSARTLAAETGAVPLLLHSAHTVSQAELDAGATYLTLMRGNLKTLREALY